MIGRELIHDDSLSPIERWYIRLFGAPICGLRIRARRILPYITPRYRNILDAGCGQGVLTFALARRLPESTVTGIDQDLTLIERNCRIARIERLINCRFEAGDITALYGHEMYDLVMNVDVLEHIEDDDAALRFFHAVLVPGGELLLHVPGYYRRWFLFGWRENFYI